VTTGRDQFTHRPTRVYGIGATSLLDPAESHRLTDTARRWQAGEVFEHFTDRGRFVLVLAQEEARLLNHSFIGTEHILLGLIHEGEGVAAKALDSLGISLTAVRDRVEETIGKADIAPSGSPPFTPRTKKVLELSLREALQLGHSEIGTEHLLLGLVREGEGVAAQVLISLGTDLARVRQQVIQLMSGYDPDAGEPAMPTIGVVVCSFCGRQPPTSGRLITKDNVSICEYCVRTLAAAFSLMEEEDDSTEASDGVPDGSES
jgi:ATP-dependent Clp protease ATP-binding subunit ClpC